MPSIRIFTRTAALSLAGLLLSVISAPALTFADSTDCVAPSSSQAGVRTPTGADAATYTYQCDGQYANKWTNPYFVYDSATNTKAPLFDRDYSYDCPTGTWYMTDWGYSPGTSKFYQSRVSTSDPGFATNCPVIAAASESAGGGGSGDSLSATAAKTDGTTTGPGSNNTTSTTLNNGTLITNNTNAAMTNTINGVATSGSSMVIGNTSAGSAGTGDAQSMANIINMLQSSSNALGSTNNTIVFTKNIDGDVNGDLFLDPTQLGSVQNASSSTDVNNKLTINNSTNASINNNVDLNAKTGDATVSDNSQAGDAKTGNAQAIANIVNTINSAVYAGQSFIGTININGNLNGDILLPDNFVDQLLAANTPTVTITGPGSTNTDTTNVNSTAKVTNTNNLGITNNVNANAKSGTANVSGNTSGGNAASGNATTNITAFNLTGSTVIGKNDLLVFVNAPGGKWVGVIVKAPAGATAASLGGGITTGPGSTNTTSTNINNDSELNNTTNAKINNNITTNASSGNANVTRNSVAGNASTGNADSRVNLANIEDSSLSLSGWLGILFINVFGTWNGSFGVNTSAGDPIVAASNGGIANGGSGVNSPAQVFRFVARTNTPGSASTTTTSSSNGSGSGENAVNPVAAALAAQTIKANNAAAPAPQLASEHSGVGRTAVIIAAAVVFYIVSDAIYTHRRNRIRSYRS